MCCRNILTNQSTKQGLGHFSRNNQFTYVTCVGEVFWICPCLLWPGAQRVVQKNTSDAYRMDTVGWTFIQHLNNLSTVYWYLLYLATTLNCIKVYSETTHQGLFRRNANVDHI